jgi:hypothetical protein
MYLRHLVPVVSCLTLAGGAASLAEATAITLPVTVAERGIDQLPKDGVFVGPQFDPGQATVTNAQFFEERALLEFNLTAIPDDEVVTSATLRIVIPDASSVGQSGAVHGYVGNGVYDNADLAVENLLTTFTITTAPGDLGIAIPIAFIQSLLAANETFAGFTLRNTTVGFGVFSFWTDATPNQNLHPTLEIETQAVPEPASLLLAGSGISLALATLARRRHRQQ